MKTPITEVLLRPDLSNEEAERKWTNKPIDPGTVKHRPSVSTHYHTVDGNAKLLLLRGVLDADTCTKMLGQLRQIQYSPATNSKRAALKGSPGGDCLFGYIDKYQLVAMPEVRRQRHYELTAPSVRQFARFQGLWPLCWKMEDLLREYIPTYWGGREIDEERGPAIRAEGDRSDFFRMSEKNRKMVEAWEDWGLFYNIPGSNFTTITVNHNTRFLAHKDANNSSGALSCLAAFGTFAGGELAFPRLGVAINAKPGDMLVCDCPQELHGTLSASQGNRYTVVVYTREGLTKKGFKVKQVDLVVSHGGSAG
jgi:hypothetical protein